MDWDEIEAALRSRPKMCCIELHSVYDHYSLEPYARFTHKPAIGSTVWVAGTHGHKGVLNDGEVLAWAPTMRELMGIFTSLA